MTTFNFPPTSRYYGIETVTVQLSATRSIAYLRRRFITVERGRTPEPVRFEIARPVHRVRF